jgi:UPF0755 protein
VTVDPVLPTPDSTPTEKRSRVPLVIGGVILLIVAGLALNFWRQKVELHRYNWAKIALPQRMARVPAQWGMTTLSQRLQASHKIRDAESFREAAEQVGLKDVEPGSYFLPAMAGPLEVAQAFKAGPTHQDVTFPEGFTVRQIAARLVKDGFVGGKQLAAAPTSDFEGKLFPDTYTLPLKAPWQDLTRTMLDRWKVEMTKLPRPFPQVNGKALTPIEVVTLASLVEREAASRAEMPLVAGVLLSRLKKPMRLQVDASVQYARLLAGLEHKPRLLFADLKIDSPFNTYLHAGLPPTPVCNPGEAALRAAAHPQTTDALFYVYSPKIKRHLFAATFEQHKHNIAVVRLERDALTAPMPEPVATVPKK